MAVEASSEGVAGLTARWADWALEEEEAAFEPVGVDDAVAVTAETKGVQVCDGVLPADVVLDSLDIWVQLHELLMGYTSDTVLEQLGNQIGTFIKCDNRFAGAPWKTFYRIRVAVPVDKPLRRRMRLMKRDKTTCWISFKYERLHNFCFFCGLLGHSHKFCLKAREAAMPIELYHYDASLRVGGARSPRPIGERWLVPAEGPSPSLAVPEVVAADVSATWVPEAEPVVVAVSKRRREGSNGGTRRLGRDVTMLDVSKTLQVAGTGS
ncbi:uncharacterized protein LOC115995828 [Ipomoea triloba]|uniref:uncharacterized protein LOC115995828 n=1 Tax=Ipomoea triloba TaxID=35885 RepID=UPI00125E3C4B|nr:uncharacterized protein LOC115995828 [Ipomoea triloba]